MRCRFVLPVVLTALPLLACRASTADGPSPDGDAGKDAGPSPTTNGVSPDGGDAPDGDAPQDAGPSATADALSPFGDAGGSCASLGDAGAALLILQAFGGASGEVAAQVPLLEPGVGQEQTCDPPLDAGTCQLTSCQLGGIGSPGPGYGNFGPLSASVGTTTVPITYDGTGYGTVYFPAPITLGTGGLMTFRGGTGGCGPTFDVSATIPGLGVITSPVAATDGGVAIIDSSQDLSVTWVPISIGQIQFTLYTASSAVGATAVSVGCTFEGASGSGVVPQTLLSTMKSMSGAVPTYAGLSSEVEATTMVGAITIETQSHQTSPDAGRDFGVTLR
jgi:hypothetical protein